MTPALVSPYAAHADAGAFGVLVANSGGTGIDYSTEGELFAELAAAAASGSASAPEPSADALAGPPAPATDACSLWTGGELAAALGVPVGPDEGDPEFVNDCLWNGQADGGAVVRVTINQEGSDTFDFEPTPDDPRILTNDEFEPRTLVVDGPIHLSVSIFTDADADVAAAQLMLAQNITTRLG